MYVRSPTSPTKIMTIRKKPKTETNRNRDKMAKIGNNKNAIPANKKGANRMNR